MRWAAAGFVMLGFVAASTCAAQSYPVKPVRFVLGFPPATTVDVLARPIAQKLGEIFGQQVIVDNRPGATGMIANEQVARAAPDGYTLLPDVPTMAEAGLRGYEMSGWHGIFAPGATPRDIVDRLNAAVVRILAAPEMKELWASQGMEVATNTPEQFAARVRADYAKYERLVKLAGIQPE